MDIKTNIVYTISTLMGWHVLCLWNCPEVDHMTQTASLVIMLTLSDVVAISQPGRSEGRGHWNGI